MTRRPSRAGRLVLPLARARLVRTTEIASGGPTLAGSVQGGARRRSPLARYRGLDRPGRILVVMVIAGLVLRVVATASIWPTNPSLADSWDYGYYAAHNVFGDPQHPAGYAMALALLGLFSRHVAVVSVLQDLLGIATAPIMFAAVRRMCGSPWPAVATAAVVLFNADGIYLEQAVMAETLYTFLVAVSLYAAVRTIDAGEDGMRWGILTGTVIAVAIVVRTDGFFVPVVVAFALLLARPRGSVGRVRIPLALLATAGVILLAYAFANLASNNRFEVGPSQGWHLYARAAPVANCTLFTPPPGTAQLCETTPVADRDGPDHYLFDPTSPAVRLFGSIGNDDGKVKSWAIDAIEASPWAYLNTAWDQLKWYFVPSSHAYVPGSGGDLDPQLDWTASGTTDTTSASNVTIIRGMESFFDDFRLRINRSGLRALHDYQRVFRVGATMMSIFALLTLMGLMIGPRRNRIGVLLFGVGGLVMLLPPSLLGTYVARYTVPLSVPLAAGAAIGALSLYRSEAQRRQLARAEMVR